MNSPQMIRLYSRKELLDTHRGWREVIPHIHTKTDEGMAGVKNLACKPGCNHCCKLMVQALPHEVMEVVDYVRFGDRFARWERAQILERLRYAVEQTDGLGAVEYRAKNLPCPFLSDNGLCLVYPVRPLTCRAFGSTKVEVCALEVEDDGSTFKIVPDSLLRLLATSGLFFTGFLKGCLDWWQGSGVESPTEQSELEAVMLTQKRLDRRGAREV